MQACNLSYQNWIKIEITFKTEICFSGYRKEIIKGILQFR